MYAPDFSSVIDHSRQGGISLAQPSPQAIPYTERTFTCECCNDTGVVQVWKLNRWALRLGSEPLCPTTSLPVLCRHFPSCGNATQQVFAGSRDTDEGASRTAEVNLFNTNSAGESAIGRKIAFGDVKCLSVEQSRYLHNRVLQYRELLGATSEGQQYIEDVKQACRVAMPPPEAQRGTKRLMHIGNLLGVVQFPDEPDWDVVRPDPAVQPVHPRDFDAAMPPRTSEPSPELPHQWPPDLSSAEEEPLTDEAILQGAPW